MKTSRWMIVPLVLIIILVFTETHSKNSIAFSTGNDLVGLMREYEKADTDVRDIDWSKVYCYIAYVNGVADATWFSYDMPDEVTRGQIVEVVSKYLKNHPEEWDDPAYLLIIKALQESFPKAKTK